MLRPGLRVLTAITLLTAAGPAQTTWVVDFDNRPGTHFTTIPPAVAAAAAGDTVLVRQASFNHAYSPGSIRKGITLVGIGTAPVLVSAAPIQVSNIPPNETFRMTNFGVLPDLQLIVDVTGCRGLVQLDQLRSVEFGAMFPNRPSITISNCDLVSLSGVETFGQPTVSIVGGTVLLNSCTLGDTSVVGGGQSVRARDATLRITEPFFEGAFSQLPQLDLTNCDTRIGGSIFAYIQAGSISFPASGPSILVNGGSLRIDPRLRVDPGNGSANPIAGTGTVLTVAVQTAIVGRPRPGGQMPVTLSGAPNAPAVALLGQPAFPVNVPPLGVLFLDPAQSIVALFAVNLPSVGYARRFLTVPTSVPVGVSFGVQCAQLTGGGVVLGNASFVTTY